MEHLILRCILARYFEKYGGALSYSSQPVVGVGAGIRVGVCVGVGVASLVQSLRVKLFLKLML